MTRTLAIGIDGGGTRARAIVESDGIVLGRGEDGPANPHSIGITDAAKNIVAAARSALRAAKRDRSELAFVALGVAGVGDTAMQRRLSAELVRRFPDSMLFLTTDVDIALAATGESANANRVVAVIAGTGSIAMARGTKGAIARAGGFGFRIGDEGSGAWIAREALGIAQRSIEGRAAKTRLVDILCRALDADHDGLRAAAHRAAESASELASLAPIVGTAAGAGDRVAQALLRDAGSRLADLATCVIRRAGLARAPDRVTLSRYGGIFERMPLVDRAFRERLAELTGVKPMPPRVCPEFAAIELARLAMKGQRKAR